MDTKRYICPVCGNIMCWNGTVSQSKETRWCSVVYHYHCINYKCRYECTFDALDDETRLQHSGGYGRLS